MNKILLDSGPSRRSLHRIALFLECAQRYAATYLVRDSSGKLGRRVTSDPLVKGSLVHIGLAHTYAQVRALQRGEDPSAYFDWNDAMEAVALKEGDLGAEHLHLCQKMVLAYREKYRLELNSRKFEILHVEEEFGIDITDEQTGKVYQFTQRPDLIWRDQTGLVWIVDHKCLPASAVVWTDHGPMPVGSLVGGTDWTAAAWDTKGRAIVTSAALAPVPAGVQAVYQIRAKGGFVGRFGYRHPILVRRDSVTTQFVPAQDLRPGDEIAVALHTPDTADSPLKDSLIALTGMLICDGAIKLRKLVWTKTDPTTRTYFKDCLHDLGLSPAPKEKLPNSPRALVTYREKFPDDKAPYITLPTAQDAPLTQMLNAIELSRVGSVEKRIPRVLMGLSKRQTGVLIGALWCGDGAAYLNKKKRAGGDFTVQVSIVYASRSGGLAADVRGLLLRLGIAASLVESSVSYKGERRAYFYVTVFGRKSKRRFIEMVGDGRIRCPAISPERVASMLEVLDHQDGMAEAGTRGCRNRDIVQTEDGDILWTPVESVLFAGKEPCFDIEVPNHHTFVAEGFVTHNTARRMAAETLMRYAPSLQMLCYRYWGPLVWGDRFGGVVINSLIWGDKVNFEFSRSNVGPAPSMVARFPQIVIDAERGIERLLAEGRDPLDWPKAASERVCMTPYGPCEAMDVCLWGAKPSGAAGDTAFDFTGFKKKVVP